MEWLRMFAPPPRYEVIDGHLYTQMGMAVCGCKHTKNEHYSAKSICARGFCDCKVFTHAKATK